MQTERGMPSIQTWFQATVLLKQEKQNKLSTPFAPEPYDVVSRNGSSFTIKSTEVVQLKGILHM